MKFYKSNADYKYINLHKFFYMLSYFSDSKGSKELMLNSLSVFLVPTYPVGSHISSGLKTVHELMVHDHFFIWGTKHPHLTT